MKKLHSGKARALYSLSVRWQNANDSRRNSFLSGCKAPNGTKLVRSKINRSSSLNLINGSNDGGMERSLITEIEINWLSCSRCRLNKGSNVGVGALCHDYWYRRMWQIFHELVCLTKNGNFAILETFQWCWDTPKWRKCAIDSEPNDPTKVAYCCAQGIIWIFITFLKALGSDAKVNANVLALSKGKSSGSSTWTRHAYQKLSLVISISTRGHSRFFKHFQNNPRQFWWRMPDFFVSFADVCAACVPHDVDFLWKAWHQKNIFY